MRKQNTEAIKKAFGGKEELKADEFAPVVTDVLGFPSFFRNMLFQRAANKKETISKKDFTEYF